MTTLRTILLSIVMACLVAPAALADKAEKTDAADKAAKPAEKKQSIERQLRLKQELRLRRENLSLVQVLDHNRESWEKLTPDQRKQFREHALAFLHKTPEEQAQLLSHYEKLIKMTAERREAYRKRAEWLNKVVATLSDEQKQALQRMTPQERARELIRLRDQMVADGKLTLGDDTKAPQD